MSIKYFKNGKLIDLASLGRGYTDLIDLFWPIGSYYETSDSSFNPNESWGGTWTQDTQGLSTVGANIYEDVEFTKHNLIDVTLGGKVGEVQHALTINEMPEHNHDIHSPFYKFSELQYGFHGDVFKGDMVQNSSYNTNNRGGSQPHNNVQPSIGVCRWHRIA